MSLSQTLASTAATGIGLRALDPQDRCPVFFCKYRTILGGVVTFGFALSRGLGSVRFVRLSCIGSLRADETNRAKVQAVGSRVLVTPEFRSLLILQFFKLLDARGCFLFEQKFPNEQGKNREFFANPTLVKQLPGPKLPVTQ